MANVDEFDKLQEKVLKMQEAQEQIDADQQSIRDAKSEAQSQLKDLQQQRSELYKQEAELKKSLDDQSKRYEELEKKKKEQENVYQTLMKEYTTSKTDRNKKLVSWWMQQYGNFDDMNLSQLKDWLAQAVISHRRNDGQSESSTNGENDQLYKEHIKKLAKVNADENADQKQRDAEATDDDLDRDGKGDQKDQNKDEAQKLADKQRIYSNRQKNEPVDTKSAAEDDDEAASPFGTEDVNKELSDFANSSSEDEPEHQLTKDEVAKQFKNEFEL